MFDKAFWYDWAGLNMVLFKAINGNFHNDTYDLLMLLISRVSDYHNFPHYLAFFLVWVLLHALYRAVRSKAGTKQYLLSWMGTLLVLCTGFVAFAGATHTLKNHFSYPRPYVTAMKGDVVHLQYKQAEEDNDYKSLPSGHAGFATLMVIGMWPMLIPAGRLAGLGFIGLVCWSRVATGMHFPADVVTAFLMTAFLTLLLRTVIYRVLLAFRIRC